jgi:glycosyltransferase involved in cell wall biosynthesis
MHINEQRVARGEVGDPAVRRMRVCHYAPEADRVEGGIRTSIQNQLGALATTDVEVVGELDPSVDILHLNLLGPRSLAAMAKARRRGIPVVAHAHTTGEDFRDSIRGANLLAPVVDRYARAVYGRADRVVAPSTYTKGLLEGRGLGPPIDVVSNGVDPERLDGWGDLEAGTDDFTVVNLGLVFERKGLPDWNATARELPDVAFRWYGPELPGLLRARGTRKLVEAAPPNASFPGFAEDVRTVFAEGDVFFFPTREENQGMSLLEAAWCGRPIVVRDIATYEGWLEDGVHCLKADGPEGFAAAIDRLRSDPDLREELGRNARAMAEDHDLEAVGGDLVDVYRRAGGEAGAPEVEA